MRILLFKTLKLYITHLRGAVVPTWAQFGLKKGLHTFNISNTIKLASIIKQFQHKYHTPALLGPLFTELRKLYTLLI